MSGLSAKHVVLGLLIERPGYGYDLTQRLRARMGFLGLAETGVYKTLERLEREGWIEEVGEQSHGTRRGAPRIVYGPTLEGRARFREWLATPSEHTVLRDELQVKLTLGDPADLPALLAVIEAQTADCLAELADLRRPVLAQAAEPDVTWAHAAVILVDDLNVRWLQTLVDWLETVSVLVEMRIDRNGQTPLRSE